MTIFISHPIQAPVRRYYRFTTHYVPTANPDAASLSALYYHQFVANKNKPVTADPPSIKNYEKKEALLRTKALSLIKSIDWIGTKKLSF